MLCAFLDDSKQEGWFGLVGFVVRADAIVELENAFHEVLRAHAIPVDDRSLDTESKWSPGRRQWLRDGLKVVGREALFRDLLALLRRYDVTAVGALLHYSGMTGYGEERAYAAAAYEHTFERINALAEVERCPVIVLVDSESSRQKTVKRVDETLNLVRDGSTYVPLSWIYQHAWTVDSSHHAGIQLADLTAGITTAMASGKTDVREAVVAFTLWVIQAPQEG